MRTFAKKRQANQQAESTQYSNPRGSLTGGSGGVRSMLHLHRAIGNQAAQQLQQNDVDSPRAVVTGTASPQFGKELTRVSLSPPKSQAIQTKPTINAIDESEREAERVSEEVIRMPAPPVRGVGAPGTASLGGLAERPKARTIPQPRIDGAAERSRVDPHLRGDLPVLVRPNASAVTDAASMPTVIHTAIASAGRPLDPATRVFMEPRFGFDFRAVRVHVGSHADVAAEAVQARAFTIDGDIVFGAGAYAPATAEGRKLLAHELTHVVQQNRNPRGPAPAIIQRDALPRRPRESSDYELRRLISELNDHVDHGRIAEAEALVPTIRARLDGLGPMERDLEAAEAFLRLGLTQDAVEVLQHSREVQFPVMSRRSFDRLAVELFVRSGEQAVAARQWGRAREFFREALRRVDEELFSGARVRGDEARWLQQFAERAIYRIMGGLIALVHHHREAAERAYRGQDPSARRRMLRARQSIHTLESDLQSVLDASAIVMAIEAQPGEPSATYRDVFDPSRALEVTHYLEQGGDFEHRRSRISSILETLRGQLEVVTDIYEYDWQAVALYRSQYGRAPNIHVLEDRRRLWELEFERLRSLGYSVRTAVEALLNNITDYLRFFSIHTEYDIDDAIHDPLTTDFPRSITQQALMDCGVYALRTAYELSLIREQANLEFHYVFVPEHVYLGIVDRDQEFGWALSNDQFLPIDPSDIGEERRREEETEGEREGASEGEWESEHTRVGVGVAVARTFNLLPAPVRTQTIGELTEEALVAGLNVARPHLYLPPDYDRRSEDDRRQAQERAVQLERQHGELRDDMDEHLDQVIAVLRQMRGRVESLEGAMDDEFVEENGEMLAALLPHYEELSEQAHRYYSDVGRVMGFNPRRYTMDCPYCELTWRALRYAGHVLGQAHLLERDFVQIPAIIFVRDLDYAGDPPPWEWVD